MRLKSLEVRKQLEEEELNRISSLNERFKSLATLAQFNRDIHFMKPIRRGSKEELSAAAGACTHALVLRPCPEEMGHGPSPPASPTDPGVAMQASGLAVFTIAWRASWK
jgi:hypothetical protein